MLLSPRLLMLVGIIATVLFLGLTVYYGTAAVGHPHFKHMLLFTGLAIVSALVTWFNLPPRGAPRGTGR